MGLSECISRFRLCRGLRTLSAKLIGSIPPRSSLIFLFLPTIIQSSVLSHKVTHFFCKYALKLQFLSKIRKFVAANLNLLKRYKKNDQNCHEKEYIWCYFYALRKIKDYNLSFVSNSESFEGNFCVFSEDWKRLSLPKTWLQTFPWTVVLTVLNFSTNYVLF